MATVVIETVLTAEEFRRLPDDGRPKELKRGRVVLMNLPAPRHGQICVQVCYLIAAASGRPSLGSIWSPMIPGIITEHDPDTRPARS